MKSKYSFHEANEKSSSNANFKNIDFTTMFTDTLFEKLFCHPILGLLYKKKLERESKWSRQF